MFWEDVEECLWESCIRNVDLFPHAREGRGAGGWGVCMWEEVVGASLWISDDFPWIGAELLHVNSHFFV